MLPTTCAEPPSMLKMATPFEIPLSLASPKITPIDDMKVPPSDIVDTDATTADP